jgi:hypothetical protein
MYGRTYVFAQIPNRILTKYNPDIHHRHSIRLRDYDYAQAGAYFVTICTKDRECLFGEILDGVMVMNDAGRVVEELPAGRAFGLM